MLEAGRAPAWLEPVGVGHFHYLRVWKVRRDLLAAQSDSKRLTNSL
jgi:hypothetical protein